MELSVSAIHVTQYGGVLRSVGSRNFEPTFLNLKKIKVGLCDHHFVCMSVSPLTSNNFSMAEPIFMRLGMYIMTPELISMVYFKSLPSLCVYMCIPLSFSGDGSVKIPLSLLGNGSVRTNIHIKQQKKLLDASCSIWSISYEGK
jgi:hypothetical protein